MLSQHTTHRQKKPTVFVGIVTHNNVSDIDRCMYSIRKQTYSPLSLVVYDNDSRDGTKDRIRSLVSDEDSIFSDTNSGFTGGHNAIIARYINKQSDWYLALNPDVILAPDYVARLVRFLMKKPEYSWATGRIQRLSENGRKTRALYSVGHALLRDGYAFNIVPDPANTRRSKLPFEVFGAPGCMALYSGHMIRSVSGGGRFFDDMYFVYNEDVDVDWRAHLHGLRCVSVPDAIGYHKGAEMTDKRRIYALTNRYLCVIKNAHIYDIVCFAAPIMVIHILFRMVFSPVFGITMMKRILSLLPVAIQKRSRIGAPQTRLVFWWEWSKKQSSLAPVTYGDRLMHYIFKNTHKKYPLVCHNKG